ncbi:MAG: hypothetical protein KR126chlam1_00327 [Chlamydiae bacterium]|nr:hypothetical protein [Chlamydiota bacterium]
MNEIRVTIQRSNENYRPNILKRIVKSLFRVLAASFKAIGKAFSSKDHTPLPGRVSTDLPGRVSTESSPDVSNRLKLIKKINETLSKATSIGNGERILYGARLRLWKEEAKNLPSLKPEIETLESILKSLPNTEIV